MRTSEEIRARLDAAKQIKTDNLYTDAGQINLEGMIKALEWVLG